MTLYKLANVDNYLRDLDNGNKLEWREYMARVIDKLGIENIKPYIPFDMKTLLQHYQNGDVHFNRTNIRTWDNAGGYYTTQSTGTGKFDYHLKGYGLGYFLRHNGINVFSPADIVCILKEAARILCEREINKL